MPSSHCPSQRSLVSFIITKTSLPRPNWPLLILHGDTTPVGVASVRSLSDLQTQVDLHAPVNLQISAALCNSLLELFRIDCSAQVYLKATRIPTGRQSILHSICQEHAEKHSQRTEAREQWEISWSGKNAKGQQKYEVEGSFNFQTTLVVRSSTSRV